MKLDHLYALRKTNNRSATPFNRTDHNEMKQGKIIALIDLWDEIMDVAAKTILQFTPQLFSKCEFPLGKINPRPLATGVFLKVQGEYFLVTAGHVLQRVRPEDIGIMVEDNFIFLSGFVIYSRDFDNDKIDLAVWRINEEIIPYVEKKYRFLDFGRVDYTHDVQDQTRYLIVGFPASRTRKDKKKRVLKPEPLAFLNKKADNEHYKKLGFEKDKSILIGYQRRKVKSFETGGVIFAPEPQGLSGCGLWYLPSLPPLNQLGSRIQNVDYKLVGIMIEHHSKYNLMVATRIHIVTEILRVHFKKALPASNILKLIVRWALASAKHSPTI